MNFAEKRKSTLNIQIPINTIIIDDAYITPRTKSPRITPPPKPKANRRNLLKKYSIIPFPYLGDIYSTPTKTNKNRCESMPPILKINRYGKSKITDIVPKRIKYDEDI
jgi:hypothetical protein